MKRTATWISIDSAIVTQSLGIVTTSCRTRGSSAQWLIGGSFLGCKESGSSPAVAGLVLRLSSIERMLPARLDARMLYELKENQIVPAESSTGSEF